MILYKDPTFDMTEASHRTTWVSEGGHYCIQKLDNLYDHETRYYPMVKRGGKFRMLRHMVTYHSLEDAEHQVNMDQLKDEKASRRFPPLEIIQTCQKKLSEMAADGASLSEVEEVQHLLDFAKQADPTAILRIPVSAMRILNGGDCG